MDTQPKRPQGLQPLGLGVLLWGTSALLTLSFFWSLAGVEWWVKTIAVAWATGLEGTKIVSWRIGGRYRWLAAALVALTLFSVWGLAVGSVEGQIETTETFRRESTQAKQDARQSIDVLKVQIEALVDRLKTTPVDFVTATNQLNQEIQRLRDILDSKLTELRRVGAVDLQGDSSPDPFSILAGALGWPRRTVVILILVIVAFLTEFSAFAMVGDWVHPIPPIRPVQIPSSGVPTEDDYLRIALDHPKVPRLLGRLEVAKRLGVHENQARVLLQRLIDQGRVRRSSKSFEVSGVQPTKRHPGPPGVS